MHVDYQLESPLENNQLLQEMSTLYSNHYGYWGATSGKKGERIKLSAIKLQEWTKIEHTFIATARIEKQLIGYAIAVKNSKNKTNVKDLIACVTQLVVHEQYRKQGIGKKLLFSFWGFSNNYAWGIMSSNPYAIRALEKATYRRVDPKCIKKKKVALVKFGINNISYFNKQTELVVTPQNSKVNTQFPSDISNIKTKLENVIVKDIPWLLGDLEEGWEWFAFTFQAQDKVLLTQKEIQDMLSISEEIANKAYSRMPIEEKNHPWARYTPKEIDFIERVCHITVNSKIADFGCGMGRHTLELLNRGYDVIGIDYSTTLLEKAKQKIDKDIFVYADCRTVHLNKRFDSIICLYDVIGSFIDNNENIKILNNIALHLSEGGYALISVMNFELTESQAKYTFDIENEPNKLLELSASNTMEQTGDIFNPDYYMIDTQTKIVYRREQFSGGSELPQELIVRDLRYRKSEIEEMCEEIGLKVIWSRYVQAGNWDIELNSTNPKAKEILVLCQKK